MASHDCIGPRCPICTVERIAAKNADKPRRERPVATSAPILPPSLAELGCIHRGGEVGRIPCGAGKGCKAKVHTCTLHAQCTMHATASAKGVHRCRGCEDLEAPAKTLVIPEKQPLRILHVGVAIVRAGAENQLESLVKFMDPTRVRFTQCIATQGGLFDPEMARGLGVPASVGGKNEVRRAVAEADVLLCWGPSELGEWLLDCRPKLTIYVAHGEGDWTLRGLAACKPIIDHVVAVSERVKEKTCAGFSCTVIPNGIDLARIAPTMSREGKRRQVGFDAGDFVLAYVGRFSKEKRPHAVIEAVAGLPSQFKALLVGWGGLEGSLRKQAEALIPGRYVFANAKTDVGDYYAAMDALCACSSEEGFSLVLLEAMFSGRPVIATRVGSVDEMLAKINNCVFAVHSLDGVAPAAKLLAESPMDYAEFADHGQLYAEQHGYARQMADRYCDLIERLWKEKWS